MYVQRNIEARSRNHCCHGKAISRLLLIGLCARACGQPGAWACACAYVHVALLIQYATRMRHIVTSFVVPLAPPYFSTLSDKWHDFQKEVTEHEMCVFIFSTILSKTFLILRRI